jgi:hypothetical protein
MKHPILVFLFFCSLFSQAQDSTKLFIFGHSLIDHRPPAIPTPSDETTVPHWLSDIAVHAGHPLGCGGQYGFLTSHDNLPPISQWGYDRVPGVWESDSETFGEADITTVIVTAANFIQYQPVDQPHPLDQNTTVLDATSNIFDWVDDQEPGVQYYIYANWPEMDLAQAYPPTVPSQSEIDAYHDYTTGAFMDWWIDYHDGMLAERPEMDVRMIPVGDIISKVLTEVIPGAVPFRSIYEDSAPHGRPTLYFLAGVVTYMALYEEKVPSDYMPDATVHPGVRANLEDIVDFAWDELNAFDEPSGRSRVFFSISTSQDEVTTPEWTISPNPARDVVDISCEEVMDKVVVLDLEGQAISVLRPRSDHISLPLASCSPGVYLIRGYGRNWSFSQKVVKVGK